MIKSCSGIQCKCCENIRCYGKLAYEKHRLINRRKNPLLSIVDPKITNEGWLVFFLVYKLIENVYFYHSFIYFISMPQHNLHIVQDLKGKWYDNDLKLYKNFNW